MMNDMWAEERCNLIKAPVLFRYYHTTLSEVEISMKQHPTYPKRIQQSQISASSDTSNEKQPLTSYISNCRFLMCTSSGGFLHTTQVLCSEYGCVHSRDNGSSFISNSHSSRAMIRRISL